MSLLLGNRKLLLIFLTLFIVVAGFGIVMPILPFYARDLGASSFQMGLLVTCYAFAQFLFAPVWGAISDRIGRRAIMITGLVGFSLSFFLMALSDSYLMLLLSRLLGGILAASPRATAQAYVADVTDDHDRAKGMAMAGTAQGLGFVFGPVIGGVLVPMGVTVPFYVSGAVALLTALAAYLGLPETRPRSKGAVKDSGGINEVLGNPVNGHYPFLARVITYAVHSPASLFFWLTFAVMFCQSSMFSMLSYFLMDRIAASESLAGLVFGVQGGVSTVVQALFVGPAVSLLGEERTIMAGMVFGVVGFLLMSQADTLPEIILAITCTATALSLVRPTITSVVSKRAELGQGVTMGIQSSFDSLGRATGPLWAGFAYGHAISLPYLTAALVYFAMLAATIANQAGFSLRRGKAAMAESGED